MKRIFVPTSSFGDWRNLLAQPDLHWKAGRSAMTLAQSWEHSHPEFPSEIRRILESADQPALAGLRILAAIPEYQVDLPGGDRPSQTDLLVLARNELGMAVIAIEGKVDEDFGPLVKAKRVGASPGQLERFDFLHRALGLASPVPDSIRYQLLHRAASAILVAQEFHAHTAVMLVHSFSKDARHFEDFAAFVDLLAGPVERDCLVQANTASGPQLFLGWCGHASESHASRPKDVPDVTLPDETRLASSKAWETIQAYLDQHSSVVELYDATNTGPHDDILPVDLLALNALNAYVGTAPMTLMDALWDRRVDIRPHVEPITTREICELSSSEVEAEIPKIATALSEIDKTPGYGGGGTRTAKLLHRLRPNIVPIWDALIGEWYGGSAQSWDDYLRAVFRDVRRPGNLEFLQSVPVPAGSAVRILRVWDMLLWKLRYEQRRAARGAAVDTGQKV